MCRFQHPKSRVEQEKGKLINIMKEELNDAFIEKIRPYPEFQAWSQSFSATPKVHLYDTSVYIESLTPKHVGELYRLLVPDLQNETYKPCFEAIERHVTNKIQQKLEESKKRQ